MMIAPPWQPITPSVTCGTLCRHPSHLLMVVGQFEVSTSPRYKPTREASWCNVFLTDVTTALGCAVPHWWMRGLELTANKQAEWLEGTGKDHGWRLVTEVDARAQAAVGLPTVVTYKAAKGHGHVAVVLPSVKPGVTEIAQAGSRNFERGALVEGFGGRSVSFFSHE